MIKETKPQSTEKETKPKTETLEAFLEAEKGEGLGISPSILENFKPDDLPSEFVDESMAAELLEHKSTYQKADVAWRSAKHTDRQRSEQMWQLRNFSRLSAAIIIEKWPKTAKLANEIAKVRVVQARRARLNILEQEAEGKEIDLDAPVEIT